MPKVIINGPECSGKTTLSEYLVKKLDAKYIQEYPRIYLEMTDGKYDANDLLIMAQDIDDLIAELDDERLWVIDTNNINIKIWYLYKYGEMPDELAAMSDNKEALHLILKPEIPWEDDPLRENPTDRNQILDMYRAYLYQNEIKYHLIGVEDREDQVLDLINDWLLQIDK